ncbi:hypothetical protein Trydic_g22520 [Trypoxylus dichotomus]
MSLSCKCCNKHFSDKDAIHCFVCGATYRLACAGLSEKETRVLRSKRNIKWTCLACCSSDISAHLKNLTSVISVLQKEISELKDKLDRVSPAQTAPFDMEDIIHELEQRTTKKTNFTIFNMAEDSSNDSAKVADILAFLNVAPQIATNNLKTLGLGRVAAGGKPRSLRVTLGTANDVKLVLRCANRLKGYPTPRIFISRDLTPRQVENKNRVLEEFRRRRSRGEDVSLKYIDGFPKIVGSKNPRDPNSQ